MSDLAEIFRLRHDDARQLGWAPRLRQRFGYFIPDEYYEAVVDKLVAPGIRWLDVGCGRNIFPNNVGLAKRLARRCELLVGIDPDRTIEENTVLHQRVVATIENFRSKWLFDLVTLRMVAEHIAEPEFVIKSLARLTKSGGKVVIYTVNKRSPVSVISLYTPFRLHGPIKQFLWDTEDKDTFPVYYRLNTRKDLGCLFRNSGFRESVFEYLDDCRSLSRFRVSMTMELCTWRILKRFGIKYPENCLLGIYERL
jgi:SAM-dependent methyltransferase